MKIIVTAVGSTGDIQPFVALAEALKRAGHTVKVCSYDIYKKKFDKISVPFAAVGPPFDDQRVSDVRDTLKKLSPLKKLDYLVNEVFLYEGEKFYADSIEASRGYHFGICHSLDFIGQHVMMQNQIPWASVIFAPGIIPTTFRTPMHLPNLGRLGNRLSWKILEWIKAGFERKIEGYLYRLNGIRRKINAVGTFSPHLNLVACSGHVTPTYPDWPSNFVVTGAWFIRGGAYTPPPEVARFVEEGEVDVVFTFGSMAKAEGERVEQLFRQAVEKSPLRAIIQQGWTTVSQTRRESANLLFVDYNLPHGYLFGRSKIVVHTGGTNTVMEVCKAGAASIVVPQLPDQKYWATVLHRLGVASKPLLPKNLAAETLTSRIRRVLEDGEMLRKARELSLKIKAEEGTENAVRAIEEFVYKDPLRGGG